MKEIYEEMLINIKSLSGLILLEIKLLFNKNIDNHK